MMKEDRDLVPVFDAAEVLNDVGIKNADLNLVLCSGRLPSIPARTLATLPSQFIRQIKKRQGV
jgi:hypothetical protein